MTMMMPLRLHMNENTAGCSPAVLRALSQLTALDVATYREDHETAARIGAWFGVRAECVLPVNGLDEGLLLAAQLAAVRTGRQSGARFDGVVVEPAFDMYASVIAVCGGAVVRVAPRPDFAVRADDILSRATGATRVVYICDPGNPTGVGVPHADILAVLRALPDALVVVDEAYADFSGRSMIGPALDEYPNLVVGRTFSKAHGLAGLRIGALFASATVMAGLRAIALPYRVNTVAQLALCVALDDRAQVAHAVADARESRGLLTDAARRLGFDTWPSDANFVLLRVGDGRQARACAAFLKDHGVLVRDRSALPGCEGCLRITAGPPLHTRRVIERLEAWHARQPR